MSLTGREVIAIYIAFVTTGVALAYLSGFEIIDGVRVGVAATLLWLVLRVTSFEMSRLLGDVPRVLWAIVPSDLRRLPW
ncbi:MAG: hypothetical protein Q7S01_03140 [bacterium]|nr:hypothetical protein [bacterium]